MAYHAGMCSVTDNEEEEDNCSEGSFVSCSEGSFVSDTTFSYEHNREDTGVNTETPAARDAGVNTEKPAVNDASVNTDIKVNFVKTKQFHEAREQKLQALESAQTELRKVKEKCTSLKEQLVEKDLGNLACTARIPQLTSRPSVEDELTRLYDVERQHAIAEFRRRNPRRRFRPEYLAYIMFKKIYTECLYKIKGDRAIISHLLDLDNHTGLKQNTEQSVKVRCAQEVQEIRKPILKHEILQVITKEYAEQSQDVRQYALACTEISLRNLTSPEPLAVRFVDKKKDHNRVVGSKRRNGHVRIRLWPVVLTAAGELLKEGVIAYKKPS